MTSKIVRSDSENNPNMKNSEEIYRQNFDEQDFPADPNQFIERDGQREERLIVRLVP